MNFISNTLNNVGKILVSCEDRKKTKDTIRRYNEYKGNYDGIVLSTFKLDLPDGKSREELKDGDEVTFTESAENAISEAAFLENITLEGGRFSAKYVSKKEVADRKREGDRTTLFCIHGCCGNIKGVLFASFEGKETFGDKFDIIPVLWPTKFLNYKKDWEEMAPKAGKLLANLVNDIQNHSFGKVSLLCHSMGNHVVFNNAGRGKPEGAPDAVFENIFMVGADVPNDIFSEKPKQSCFNDDFKYKETKAEHLIQMLNKKTGGKIYVLNTKIDTALQGSSSGIVYLFRLFRPRLGTTGAINIREDFADKVVNIDVTSMIEGEQKPAEMIIDHLYQYDPWAVKLYNDAHIMTDDEFRETYKTYVKKN